jgi:hypothetical protein
MTELTVSSQGTGHRSRWKWSLALGAFLLLLGIGGVTFSLLELTFALVFGPMLLASSLLQLMTTFFAGTRRERLPHYLAAGLEMALGFLIMVHPPGEGWPADRPGGGLLPGDRVASPGPFPGDAAPPPWLGHHGRGDRLARGGGSVWVGLSVAKLWIVCI